MVNILLESFNLKLLDFYILFIKKQIKKSDGFSFKSVILPNKIKRWSVIKSPHVNSKSKEQFEMRTHVRLVVVQLENLKISPLIHFFIIQVNLLNHLYY